MSTTDATMTDAVRASPSTEGLERSRVLHATRLAMGFYEVPCNGCTLCCHNDAIRILPHEDASRWETVPHDWFPGARMLAHKPNGDCIYLGESGCTRQHDKPQMCHEMDCRRVAQAITAKQAKQMDKDGRLKITVYRRGLELLRSNAAGKAHPEGDSP